MSEILMDYFENNGLLLPSLTTCITACVCIDFSKAFDCNWPDISLKKLKLCGISPDVVDWIDTYLIGRSWALNKSAFKTLITAHLHLPCNDGSHFTIHTILRGKRSVFHSTVLPYILDTFLTVNIFLFLNQYCEKSW